MSATPTLSAGVVVVRRIDGLWHYLLLRAYHYWDFPKGQVEPGEDPLVAAIRETGEETTLTRLNFRWGHAHVETEPYGKNKIARYYIAESTDGRVFLPVTEELGKPEHEEYLWMDYDAARPLLVPRVQAIVDWAQEIILDRHLG
ncbi:MAG: NUDIX domain-containing protein [Sulfuricaulis sp.]